MEVVRLGNPADRWVASDDLRVVGDEQGERCAILFSPA